MGQAEMYYRLYPSCPQEDNDAVRSALREEAAKLVKKEEEEEVEEEKDEDEEGSKDGNQDSEDDQDNSEDDEDDDTEDEDDLCFDYYDEYGLDVQSEPSSSDNDPTPPHKPCPITTRDFGPVCQSGFTPRQMMALQAYYLPMVQPGYSCLDTHVLALLGTDREEELLEKLRSDPDSASARDSAGNTPLMLACAARHPSLSLVQTLLSEFPAVDVNAENEDGLTALHFAVLSMQTEIVSTLLENKADVNAGRVEWEGKYYGLTPLLMCIIVQNVNCLEVLLRSSNLDLSVETVHSDGSHTKLLRFHYECACSGCNAAMMDISKSILPPSQIKTGTWKRIGNALYYTLKGYYHSNMFGLLLDHLQASGQMERALEESCGRDLFPINSAIHNLVYEDLSILLARHPGLAKQVNRGITPLHQVLGHPRNFKRHLKCSDCGKRLVFSDSHCSNFISIIINSPEVDVNARTSNKQQTPLMWAAGNGHHYVMERLLELGADPMAEDVHGTTALLMALDLRKAWVREKVLMILFRTGISHEIYKQSFANSVILKELCENRDILGFDLFFRTGAISDSNRLAMIRATQAATVDNAQEEKEKENFLKMLKLFRRPCSLERQVILALSARMGVGSEQDRATKLKRMLHAFDQKDDGGGDRVDDDRGKDCKNMDEREAAGSERRGELQVEGTESEGKGDFENVGSQTKAEQDCGKSKGDFQNVVSQTKAEQDCGEGKGDFQNAGSQTMAVQDCGESKGEFENVGSQAKAERDRGESKGDFQNAGSQTKAEQDGGEERGDFENTGSQTKAEQDCGESRGDFENVGSQTKAEQDGGEDRGDFENVGSQTKAEQDRGEDRGDFENVGSQTKRERDGGEDRGDFQNVGSQTKAEQDCGESKGDFEDVGSQTKTERDGGESKGDFENAGSQTKAEQDCGEGKGDFQNAGSQTEAEGDSGEDNGDFENVGSQTKAEQDGGEDRGDFENVGSQTKAEQDGGEDSGDNEDVSKFKGRDKGSYGLVSFLLRFRFVWGNK